MPSVGHTRVRVMRANAPGALLGDWEPMAKGIPATLRWLAVALATTIVAAPQIGPVAAQQGQDIEIETFHRELEPYGRWFEHPRYGHVWAPDVEDEEWRPYTRGTWVHTEEHGWYWESEEPFGWAVYHYGRWFRDDQDGWVWVPGSQWGPAWVAWRHSDEEIGWAPLPPEAEWRDGEISLAASFYDSPRFQPAWCFVPVAMLTAGRVWTHLAAPRRNAYYMGRTRFVPHHRSSGFGFYNGGFDRRRWEGITGRRIASHRITTVDRPFWDGPRGSRSGGDIRVYRPRVTGLPRNDGRPGFNPPTERRTWPERRPGGWGERRPGGPGDRNGDGRRDSDWRRDRGFDRPEPRQPAGQPEPPRQGRGAPFHPSGRPDGGRDGGSTTNLPRPRVEPPQTGGSGRSGGGNAGPISMPRTGSPTAGPGPRNGEPSASGGGRGGGTGQAGGPRAGSPAARGVTPPNAGRPPDEPPAQGSPRPGRGG